MTSKKAETINETAVTVMPEGVTDGLNAVAKMERDYSDGRDLVNQLVGQAQAASMVEKFVATVATSRLAYIKEHKLYGDFVNTKSGNVATFEQGTWPYFCEAIGLSRRKIDEDIANLKAFGEAALESMQAMGIGYRDMSRFRKLELDDRSELIEIAKEGDKDSFIAFAEDMTYRHVKEKKELTKQLAEVRAGNEAIEKLIATKNEAIDRFQTQLEAKKDKPVAPDAVLTELQNAAQALSQQLAAQLMTQMRSYLTQIRAHDKEHGTNCDDLMQGYLDYVDREIIGLKEGFVFTRYVNGMPEWVEWDQRQQMIADGAARLAAADDAQLTADEAIINGDDSGE